MSASEAKRSYEELAAICARLEAESGRSLVMQRDLFRAKDQVDGELMRFKAIQTFIAKALDASSEEEFATLTLESIIEAFEHEVALFLLTTENDGVLEVACAFGFDQVPETLEFSPDWIDHTESRILESGDALIDAWPAFALARAVICPFHDKRGDFAGAILSGVTLEGEEFYEAITDEHSSAFTVMVRQAGALWINRQLNAEILQHNARLVSLTQSYSRFVPFQFLDLLERSSIEDINAVQALLLTDIVDEISVRDLRRRAYHIGPSIAYNLKKLLECGYVDQERSAHDRRSVRVRPTEAGSLLCEKIFEIERQHAQAMFGAAGAAGELETARALLQRVEESWSGYVQSGQLRPV